MAGTIVADKWQNGDGTENYKCCAWVNFNGTGTVAIRASGNVSSITDNAPGYYRVNFTTAMPDANYCANVTTDNSSGSGFGNLSNAPQTSNYLYIYTVSNTYTVDAVYISVAIFR